MKRQLNEQKLKLNKRTIAALNLVEMATLKAGGCPPVTEGVYGVSVCPTETTQGETTVCGTIKTN